MSIDEMISKLDGACGRMLTVAMQNPVIREAMEMVTEVSIALGEMGQEMENSQYIPDDNDEGGEAD